MDFKRRLAGLQKKMEENGLGLVVYGSCQNFQYLTGLLLDWRRGIDLGNEANNVFVSRKGAPILTLAEAHSAQTTQTWIMDVRILKNEADYGELVEKVISEMDLKGSKIGLGDHLWGSTIVKIARALKGADFCNAEVLMGHLRIIKEREEVERLRKVAQLTDKVMEAVIPKIRKGVTQRELELEVEFYGRRFGASDISFSPTAGFVKSGSEVSPNPFTYPKDKGLVSGTSIAFDIGFVMDGYCSDFGRSFYFGPANLEVKRGYKALQRAVLETVDKMYDASLRVCDLFPTVEKTLDRLGFGDYLRARLPTRNLGHSIGVEVNEPPWLSPAYNEILREGMVVALEPKLWHTGEYYLRVEDIVLVGLRSAEFLTNFDRELFQL
ncbi:MAG: Xaa-Pro peptidase family protein [Candidatus Bathyarchaeota archaeon]|nr:Xaa-Pro peptidase family protein [Candidatus Bathyarchaeota archaeon]MDH5786793.1 Xaa-Pro peptidase family protein [Candidatus Bathyarchaeota archaeon]